ATVDAADVRVVADVAETAIVETLTMAGAAAVGIGGGSGFGLEVAGAVAVSLTKVVRVVTATIDDAVVTATGEVEVRATDDARVRNDAGGAALAVSIGGSIGGTVAAGIAIAETPVA